MDRQVSPVCRSASRVLRDKALDPAHQTGEPKPYSISKQMLRLGVETGIYKRGVIFSTK
jgi:hypothetical protein